LKRTQTFVPADRAIRTVDVTVILQAGKRASDMNFYVNLGVSVGILTSALVVKQTKAKPLLRKLTTAMKLSRKWEVTNLSHSQKAFQATARDP